MTKAAVNGGLRRYGGVGARENELYLTVSGLTTRGFTVARRGRGERLLELAMGGSRQLEETRHNKLDLTATEACDRDGFASAQRGLEPVGSPGEVSSAGERDGFCIFLLRN